MVRRYGLSLSHCGSPCAMDILLVRRAKAKGLAGSMPKIDQEAIATTLVPVPSLDRQRELITQLVDIGETCARLTDALAEARLQGAALRRALLDAAFSGRLTSRASDVAIAKEMASV